MDMHGQYLSKQQPAWELATLVDEVLTMLAHNDVQVSSVNSDGATAANLLKQCQDLCAAYQPSQQDPVRTIHHLACTGGTLITKCLSAMPNTQVLSEVDPLSSMPLINNNYEPLYAPTDMITLAKQSNKVISQELIVDLFASNLKIIHKNAVENGQRLLLRDHAHSHFNVGSSIPDRPNLRSIISQYFPSLSVVTVRHPIDSYQSLKIKKWHHYFAPSTLDEYCKRYLLFLDEYENVPVLKYEDFAREPKTTMSKLCQMLDLPYTDDFVDTFSIFRVTGDSGRRGGVIEPRERRILEVDVLGEAKESESYQRLVERLEYGGV